MIQNPYAGKFIVFEGLDGSGSTTQSDKLNRFMRAQKQRSHLTKEPTNYLIGGLIRSWLSGDWSSSAVCLQLLFTSDRAHHLEKEIIPLLEKGVHVISDRYFLSTMAYGALEIPDKQWLVDVNRHFIQPDLTILLKVSSAVCIKRMLAARHSLELFEKEQELAKVWRNYLYFSRELPNIVIVDGEQSEDFVFEDIKKAVVPLISPRVK